MTFKDLEKTITKTELKKYKSKQLCFALADIWYDSATTLKYIDSLEDALKEAKDFGESVFVFKKKYVRDCLDTQRLYEDLMANVERNGYELLYNQDEEQRFAKVVTKWFRRYVGCNWIVGDFIGQLVEG